MKKNLEMSFLGSMRVVVDGQAITGNMPVKYQALLAYLAISGQPHSRFSLTGLFWGDVPEEKAKNSLRVALSSLRKYLPDYLAATYLTVTFTGKDSCWLDIVEFERLAQSSATADLYQSLELYRGDFLAGLEIEAAPAFNEWLLAQRGRWQQQVLASMESLADRLLARRAYDRAVEILVRWLAIEPWHEAAHRNLMTAYSRQGRIDAALAQYDQCRQTLRDKLGVAPMPATTAVYDRIRQARQAPRRPLPQPGTPFIGRQAELEHIAGCLAGPECRLLTITGLGGMGKSHLALEAAARVNREKHRFFLNGIAYVSLAAADGDGLTAAAIAEELDPGSVGTPNPMDKLTAYLRQREMLLVLDNFEDHTAGLPLITNILTKCPDVKLLVTSREPLNLAVEWRLNLDGLDYPEETKPPTTPDAAMSFGAVRLFVQSAVRAKPDFSLRAADVRPAVRLCQLVSGTPLAIQLAAAWLRFMPLQEITVEIARSLDILRTRMPDVPPRQRSMRAVLEQTWSLLSEPESQMFQAVSVFRGGFTLEAAQDVLKIKAYLLAGLIDRGLLQMIVRENETRYGIHELSRRFAAEKLAESDGAAVMAARHSAFYLAVVAGHEADLYGEKPQSTLSRLLPDIQNVRQAWRWAASEADFERLEQAVEGLTILFDLPGLYQEAQSLFGDAIAALARESAARPAQVVICHLALKSAFFHLRQGNTQSAYTQAQKGLELADRLGHDLYTADANALLGDISKRRPLDKATGDYYQQASVLYREVGVIRPLASLNNSLGWHHFYNAPEKAMGHFQEAYAGHSRIGNILGMATSSGSMALLQFDRGEPDEAAARLKDSLAYYEKGGYLAGASAAAHNLGTIYYQLGRYETALTYFDRSLEIKRQLGTLMELFLTIGSVGVVKIEVGDYGEARRQLEEALHFFEESGPESELLVVLWELARLAARTGHFSEAEANLERVRQLARGGENPNWRALAISTALLARLYHYRGQEAQALTYFEEAKEYFEHYRQPFDEARFLLLPKAALWVGQNKLEAAQGLIEQIRPLQAGDSAIVLNSMLLEVRIAHAGGRMEDARAILASLVPHPERPSDPALIQYELFHLKRNRQEAELALSLFKNLTAKTPDISYQERLQELELFLETAD